MGESKKTDYQVGKHEGLYLKLLSYTLEKDT